MVIFKSTSATPSTSALPPQKSGLLLSLKKIIITVQEEFWFNVSGSLISLSLTRSRWRRQGIKIGTEKVPSFEVAKSNNGIKARWKIKTV